MNHVPATGFTQASLRAGAQSAGYLSVTTDLFPRGEYELIAFHLASERLALQDRMTDSPTLAALDSLPLGSRVRTLVLERLAGNVRAGTVPHWTRALGHMSLAENIRASVTELGLLADEIWFLARDVDVDSSWYTKRAALAAVYAATETFQAADQSSDFRDTEAFLDRRLDEVRTAGGAWRAVREWAGHQGIAAVNLARSLGMRI